MQRVVSCRQHMVVRGRIKWELTLACGCRVYVARRQAPQRCRCVIHDRKRVKEPNA